MWFERPANVHDYVIPDDVKSLILPVLARRVVVTADAVMGGRTSQSVLDHISAEVAIPVTGTD